MTYRDLLAEITMLGLKEMDSEVTFYDPESGRYHPVSKLGVENTDPSFPPLVYLEILNDKIQPLNPGV